MGKKGELTGWPHVRVSFVPPSVPRLTETNATRPTHARKCKALVVANVKIAKCEETTRLHLTCYTAAPLDLRLVF